MLKAGFVLLNSFLLLPFAGHVLNGFSYVSNRWIWAYGMLIAYIFVKIYPGTVYAYSKEKRKVFVILLVYCVLALLPEAARTQRNLMAMILLTLSVFYRTFLWKYFCENEKSLSDDRRLSDSGILFNIAYQYSYERDYLSEFTDSGEALEKLEDRC